MNTHRLMEGYPVARGDGKAYKELPRLRESLRWFKRELIRQMERQIAAVSSEGIRLAMYDRLRKIRASKPAALRFEYMLRRVAEIREAPIFEVGRVCRSRFERLHATQRLTWPAGDWTVIAEDQGSRHWDVYALHVNGSRVPAGYNRQHSEADARAEAARLVSMIDWPARKAS